MIAESYISEFDTADIVYKLRDKDFSQLEGGVFVRPVRIAPHHGASMKSLVDYLNQADKEMTAVASKCGSLVIPHAWGFAEIDPEKIFGIERIANILGATFLPKALRPGHGLLAEVEVIKPISLSGERLESSKKAMIQGIEAYERERRGLLSMTDLNLSQFTHGTTRSIKEPTQILHDIDPIIGIDTY